MAPRRAGPAAPFDSGRRRRRVDGVPLDGSGCRGGAPHRVDRSSPDGAGGGDRDAGNAAMNAARDILFAALLAAAMAASSWHRSSLLPDVIYQYFAGPLKTTDMWFDADIPRTMCMAVDAHAAQHAATSDHPLLSSLVYF